MPDGFTFEQLRKCAEREVSMRARVYGRSVSTPVEEARKRKELAMMKAIAAHLKTMEQPELSLGPDR